MDGDVYISDTNYSDDVYEKAHYNETGCYNSNHFEKGLYDISFSYRIYPPVQYDDEFYHMNIKIVNNHIPYKNFEIVVHDENDSIYKIYPHPPMHIEKGGSNYLLKGKSQKNGLIEIELLLKNYTDGKFLQK